MKKNKGMERTIKVLSEALLHEWDKKLRDIEMLRKQVKTFANGNPSASAEIESSLQIRKEFGEDIHIMLLASDTVLSRLAAEITAECLAPFMDVQFNEKKDVISGLQAFNYKEFVGQGIPNLVREVDSRIQSYQDVYFNITGGYKGAIPYMTIMAQVFHKPTVYLFEDTKKLIVIPKAPITFDFELFEAYGDELEQLEEGIDNYPSVKNKNFAAFTALEENGLVELLGAGATLSPIGMILYEQYLNQFYSFFCPDNIWKDIQQRPNIKEVLDSEFYLREQRAQRNKSEDTHKTVYKKAGTEERIYYFENDRRLYIYKVFSVNEHDKHEEYIQKYPLTNESKERIISQSKRRQWRKK
jgi:putative CRISPR-associated protein (TIGR02619 family)